MLPPGLTVWMMSLDGEAAVVPGKLGSFRTYWEPREAKPPLESV